MPGKFSPEAFPHRTEGEITDGDALEIEDAMAQSERDSADLAVASFPQDDLQHTGLQSADEVLDL